MSLRLKLFLGLGSLIAVLVTAQWWWIHGLTRDLTEEVDSIAITIGQSVASHLVMPSTPCSDEEDCPEEIFVHADVEPPVERVAQGSSKVKVVAIAQDGVTQHHRITVPAPENPTDSNTVTGSTVTGSSTSSNAKADVHFIRRPQGQAFFIPNPVLKDGSPDEHSKTQHAEDGHQSFSYQFIVEQEDAGENRSWTFLNNPDNAPRYLTFIGSGNAPDSRFMRRIRLPNQGLNDKIELFRRKLLLGSLALLGLGLLLAALVAHRISAPLRRLASAATEVGDGALGTQIPVTATGEVGQAITAFNRMSGELQSLDENNRQLRARQHLGEIGEISRGLAHTLRNPLNALGLSVEELAAQAPPEANGLAVAARRQIRRIDHSIRSFLALASQGGGAVENVNLGELAQDVALEALQDSKNEAVRLEVDTDTAPSIQAVAPELRAVIQALVVNAVEASPANGKVLVRATVINDSGSESERARIEITDQGPGLPDEIRDRLFTPHLTTKATGSGMGLFLAHRIATTRYDGRLELLPNDDGGTRAVLDIGPRREEPAHA